MRREDNLLPNGIPKYIRCYDNGGETADRYTVCFTGRYRHKTAGEVWVLGMSEAPYHPQGVGMHNTYRNPVDRPRYGHLGKRIPFEALPPDCRRLVIHDYRYLWDLRAEYNRDLRGLHMCS